MAHTAVMPQTADMPQPTCDYAQIAADVEHRITSGVNEPGDGRTNWSENGQCISLFVAISPSCVTVSLSPLAPGGPNRTTWLIMEGIRPEDAAPDQPYARRYLRPTPKQLEANPNHGGDFEYQDIATMVATVIAEIQAALGRSPATA